MGFLGPSKSKKLFFAGGAVLLILGGFFALKFMTGGGGEVKPERSQSAFQSARTATRTEKKTSPPEKKESLSPLFEALKELKDPFRTEDPFMTELQDKISSTKKEIEYLKASLEEKKLRQEIKEIEKSLNQPAQTATVSQGTQSDSTGEAEEESKTKETVIVKGILFTDEEKSVLLISKERKNWVHEGEYFDGWEIKRIYKDRVVLSKAGRDYIFFCGRFGVTQKGEL